MEADQAQLGKDIDNRWVKEAARTGAHHLHRLVDPVQVVKGSCILRKLDDPHWQRDIFAFQAFGCFLTIPALIDLPQALLDAGATLECSGDSDSDLTI
jgi:hypothetical protein